MVMMKARDYAKLESSKQKERDAGIYVSPSTPAPKPTSNSSDSSGITKSFKQTISVPPAPPVQRLGQPPLPPKQMLGAPPLPPTKIIPAPANQVRSGTLGTGYNYANQPSIPAPPAPNSINNNSIRAEVEARLAKQRAGIKGAVDYTKEGLKNSYDYTRGLQTDERVLQDASLERNLTPFSGKTGYERAMVDRNRSIADTARDKDYNADVAAADRRLADFDALAPEQQDALYDQLLRQEKEFGLAEGALTGNYKNQRTLAAQGQDFNQGMAQQQFGYQQQRDLVGDQRYDQQFGYQQGRDQIADSQQQQQLDLQRQNQQFDQQRQSKIDNWNAYLQSVGLTGNLGSGAKADWSLLGGTGGEPSFEAKSQYLQQEGQRINNEIAKIQLENLPQEQKLNIQRLQREIAQIGVRPAQSAVDAEMDKIKLDTAREQLSRLQNKPTDSPSGNFNLDDFKGHIDKNFYSEVPADPSKPYGPTRKQLDAVATRRYVIGLGLPDAQTDQLLMIYGLPTN